MTLFFHNNKDVPQYGLIWYLFTVAVKLFLSSFFSKNRQGPKSVLAWSCPFTDSRSLRKSNTCYHRFNTSGNSVRAVPCTRQSHVLLLHRQ